MNFNELTRARYSLRKFDSRPIEEEKLHLLLQAAQSAPTAHNNQPQYLLVCKSPDALARVDRCTTMHFGAPVVLVVCYDPAAAWVRTGIDGKTTAKSTPPSPPPRSCCRRRTWAWAAPMWVCLTRRSWHLSCRSWPAAPPSPSSP